MDELFEEPYFIQFAIFYPLINAIIDSIFRYMPEDILISFIKSIVGWVFFGVGLNYMILNTGLDGACICTQVIFICATCASILIQIFGPYFDNFDINFSTVANILVFTLILMFFIGNLALKAPSIASDFSRILFGITAGSYFGMIFNFNLIFTILIIALAIALSAYKVPLISLAICTVSYINSQMIVDGIQLFIQEIIINGYKFTIFDHKIALAITVFLTFIGAIFNINNMKQRSCHQSNPPILDSSPPSYQTFSSSADDNV